MSEAKENPRCAVHYHMFSDGQCSCPNTCDNCGVTYVGGHSKDECLTVLKNRLRLNELAATITALSAGRESMSNEELIAAAKADLLDNLKPGTYKDKFGDIRWVGTGERVSVVIAYPSGVLERIYESEDDAKEFCRLHPRCEYRTGTVTPSSADKCEGGDTCWFNQETGYREYCPKHEVIIADKAMESPNWVQKVSDDIDRQFATLPVWKQKLHTATPPAPVTEPAGPLDNDFLYLRNKWHMLCNSLSLDAANTCVAEILDKIPVKQRCGMCGASTLVDDPDPYTVSQEGAVAHHPNCSFPIYPCGCENGKSDPGLYFSTAVISGLPPLPDETGEESAKIRKWIEDNPHYPSAYWSVVSINLRRERQLAVSQAENKALKHTVADLSAKVAKLSEQVLDTRLALVLSDAILPEEFEPELPPTERLHAYIASQHEKMRQAIDKLGSGL